MPKSVVIKIEGDSKEYKRSLKDVGSSTKSLGLSSLKTAGMIGAVSVAIFAVGKALKTTITAAAQMEDIGVQFEVLTGSALRAKQVLKDLQEFSAGTPFQFKEIAGAGKLLLAFGFEAGEVKDRIREIGDVSAATGQSLGDLATIYGQVTAAGKLTGERLNQLQERSINIAPAIAKVFGVAESSVRDLVSRGAVSAEIFREAFASMSKEGGIAFEGLAKKSATLNGKLSTLSDNWDIFTARLGKKFVPATKQAASWMTKLIQAMTPKGAATTLKEVNAEVENLSKKLKEARSNIFKKGDINLLKKDLAEARDLQLKFKKEEAIAIAVDKKKATEKAKEEDIKAAIELEKDMISGIAQINLEAEQEKLNRRKEMASKFLEGDALILENEKIKLEEMRLIKEAADIESLADKEKFLEAQAKLDKSEVERAIKVADAKLKADQSYSQAKINIASSTARLIKTIFGEENKEAFLLAQGAAVANAFMMKARADMGALASSRLLPPLASEAYLAKSLGVNNVQFGISLATIAAQTVQGFEQGGVVGGFSGATAGGDNTLITARNGEMFLNAGDQKGLFDFIKSTGAGGEGGSSESVEINLSMSGDIVDFIEAEVIRRRAIGTSRI